VLLARARLLGVHARKAKQIRGTGPAERNAGRAHDVVAWLREAFLERRLAREVGYRVDVGDLVRQHGMHAPDQRQPPRGQELRREAQERRLGALARRANSRRPGVRVDDRRQRPTRYARPRAASA